jgi:glycosyltransferase involved in cell wall biosynthesis
VLQQRSDAISFDIVVVNDGSTDATGDIVRALNAPEIRLIETPNQGIAKGRNLALDHLSDDNDLITSLDADDLFPAGRFARDVSWFANDPELEVLYGFVRYFRQAAPDGLSPAEGTETVDLRSINLGCGLYRSDLVRAVGKFDESLEQAEDTDWIMRVFERRPRYRVVDDICLYYRRHRDNITNDRRAVQRHFAHAMLKATRRRRDEGAAMLPPDLFDIGRPGKDPLL